MAEKVKVGIIGCGNISGAYLSIAKKLEPFAIVACADMNAAAAEAKAKEFGIRAMTVDALLADPGIRIVINLTIPLAHGDVGLAALKAGKCVYNEKPLAATRAQAAEMLRVAKEKGLLVGGAPDTFMGAGIQTCRKLIDDGAIGIPVAATAFMMGHGHESWHPNPEFFYKPGGGPMFDMGPYYLTALVNLMGPVRRVTGSTRATFPTRTITSDPRKGQTITVETPTHLVAVLDFVSGAVGTLITSFDVWAHTMPNIQVYGSEGSMAVPDPNSFGGPVKVAKAGSWDWIEVPVTRPYAENSRGLGVAEIACALRRPGRAHRASGALAYHVLDIMHAVDDASRTGRHVELTSGVDRPAALPEGLAPGTLDA